MGLVTVVQDACVEMSVRVFGSVGNRLIRTDRGEKSLTESDMEELIAALAEAEVMGWSRGDSFDQVVADVLQGRRPLIFVLPYGRSDHVKDEK